MSNGGRLRTRLETGGLLTAPGVFDGLSAHLVRRMGFEAAYLTGAGTAASAYGLPDIGIVGAREMIDRAHVICEILADVPLLADADTGYGSVASAVRTARAYERAGVAAIQLEDQEFPKRCGHLPGKTVVPTDEFARKIGAVAEATDEMVIIARTDARGGADLDEAIERVNAYLAAGADVAFVEAPHSAEEIERIARDVDGPTLINVATNGLTPDLGHDRFGRLGVSIVIHPGDVVWAAAKAMAAALASLGGRPMVEGRPGVSGFFDLVGLAEWEELEERWS